ncbi:MAG: adenylyl-sulfate kinase [Desulfobacteraceae bacterium]|nr:adenylyl-sulfate kinase [Desulfobacteraceae bacterium]
MIELKFGHPEHSKKDSAVASMGFFADRYCFLVLKVIMSHIVWHHATVTRLRREQLNGHRAVNLWFTGLSGSGKSTLAHAVEERLHSMGCRTFVFDGDNVRHGLCSDLGFSIEDRSENIRRIAEMVKLFLEAGVIALTAFISPLEKDRQRVKSIIGGENMLEIHCDCPLEICEQRDVKGLYKKARAGLIKNYTGISSPYEAPANPDLCLETGIESLADSVQKVVQLLFARSIVGGVKI